MLALVVATAIFLALHFGLSSMALRPRLVASLGEDRFRLVYSLAAGVTLAAMIWAFARAPIAPMWEPVHGMRWVAIVLMPLACILLVAGVSQRNPTMVAGSFAPAGAAPATGALRITRHPVMWGIGLWGIAHVASAGTVRGFVVFGALAALALLGTERIDIKRAAGEPAAFGRLAAATSNLPFRAIVDGRQSLGAALAEIGAARLAGGVALYVALILAHPWIAGRTVF